MPDMAPDDDSPLDNLELADPDRAVPSRDGALTTAFLTDALLDSNMSTAFGQSALASPTMDATWAKNQAIALLDRPPPEEISARGAGLLREAEMRAEQQAMARVTMLDLAHALQESCGKRRELEAALWQEQKRSEVLRGERDKLQVDLDKALEAEEKYRTRGWQDRIEAHAQGGKPPLLLACLLWSRQAFPVAALGDNGVPVAGVDGAPSSASGVEGAAVPAAPVRLTIETCSEGDRLTLKYMMRFWKEESAKLRIQSAAEREAREHLRLLEERHRRELVEQERRVEAERRISRALEAKLEAVQDVIRANERRIKGLEVEKAELLVQAAELAERHKREIEELDARIVEAHQLIVSKDLVIAEVNKVLQETREAHRVAMEQAEAEKRGLKAQIRELISELQQAIILAKHMRETALKAKRDAANCVSPEKFADLITELEEMRDKLVILGREVVSERESSSWLRSRLTQSRRRLELERQFLPLLHEVRGPVGPKNKVLCRKEAPWGAKGSLISQVLEPSAPALAAGDTPQRLRMSSSAGFLETNLKGKVRQALLGQPLPSGSPSLLGRGS